MAGSLSGKVALITGGSSGIGRASALAFAREGAKVVIADVNTDGGEETAEIIRARDGDALFVHTDVTKATDVEAMVDKIVEAHDRLDCAFNNAGVLRSSSIVECTEEDWDLTMSVNLKGVWLCMKYEILQMLKQGGGAIVNTASIFGLAATGTGMAYIASKHGVVGLTKTGALQYAQKGIRVNAVCPGYTRTPMLKGIFEDPDREAAAIALHPMGRVGTPEDMAEAVVWLCSDAASFVTGHAMVVDGGYLAR